MEGFFLRSIKQAFLKAGNHLKELFVYLILPSLSLSDVLDSDDDKDNKSLLIRAWFLRFVSLLNFAKDTIDDKRMYLTQSMDRTTKMAAVMNKGVSHRAEFRVSTNRSNL